MVIKMVMITIKFIFGKIKHYHLPSLNERFIKSKKSKKKIIFLKTFFYGNKTIFLNHPITIIYYHHHHHSSKKQCPPHYHLLPSKYHFLTKITYYDERPVLTQYQKKGLVFFKNNLFLQLYRYYDNLIYGNENI